MLPLVTTLNYATLRDFGIDKDGSRSNDDTAPSLFQQAMFKDDCDEEVHGNE